MNRFCNVIDDLYARVNLKLKIIWFTMNNIFIGFEVAESNTFVNVYFTNLVSWKYTSFYIILS